VRPGDAPGLEDCVAVALWLPPGVEPDGETVIRLMRESMNDKTFEDIRPDRPHPQLLSQLSPHNTEVHTMDRWYQAAAERRDAA